MPALVAHLAGLLPAGPFYFPPEEAPTSPSEVLLAELVREQVLRARARRSRTPSRSQVEEIEEPRTT